VKENNTNYISTWGRVKGLDGVNTNVEVTAKDTRAFMIDEGIDYRDPVVKPFTYSGTINLNASKEEIMNAAKIANCHDFISKLPKGYDTYIGEEGSTLSGGEKQRISIARALLKNSPIILLDEATASLDADSEHEIKMALNELIKDKTVIIIAHRLNTIKDANKIIVMDDGKIIESGNHEKLMNDKGTYYSMFTAMEKAKEFSI